jgi:DNA-binding beta-propeller fold protein YncE
MFKGADFGEAGRIALGDDADNIRVDAAANRIFVGYGSGALAVIDPANGRKIADIPLGGHPESFQLHKNSSRIFVNVPTKQLISVVDRANGNHLATWPTGNGTHFAMAQNDEAQQLFVAFRTPAKLAVFAMESGALVASVETCGDIDDMFMDAKRGRLYVTCGEGFVDVFDARSPYPRLSRITTVPGARTGLFVPETDRLYVAARASRDQPATLWVFRPAP